MNDRDRLKAMIAPRAQGCSWFVAHFNPPPRAVWHPRFVEFMDLRHRIKADFYPCKYFEYCLLDGFNWAECLPFKECPGWDKWKNCPDELKGIKFGGGGDDCKPITYGQFLADAGPIAEANRAAWRLFMERHRLDKEITRAADEMQPGIEYYITHSDIIGVSLCKKQHPELEEPTPLPVWLADIVTNEPEPWPEWMRPSGQERLRREYEAEIERVTRLNAARGLDNEGRPLKSEGDEMAIIK